MFRGRALPPGRHSHRASATRNVGDYIILSPPLILDRENIDTLISTLRGAIEATMTDLTNENIWQPS
jgi:adenosylmethionine-8-amino-7-oxononanoate aminotransferase